MQDLPHGGALIGQLGIAVGWVVGYVGWSRWYYRRLDPALRGRLARRVGAPVVWVYRRGTTSGGTMSFRLPVSTWSWGIDDADRSTLGGAARDSGVFALYVLTVPVLAGLVPCTRTSSSTHPCPRSAPTSWPPSSPTAASTCSTSAAAGQNSC